LERVIAFAAAEGIADKSLREIARGAATSHRMLLYHFGSREGLLAAIVAAIEAQQRAVMVAMAEQANTPRELMLGLWEQVSREELRPFVKLFFEVFGLVAQGAPGTEGLRETLTQPWLTDAAEVAKVIGVASDPAELRVGVAVSRGCCSTWSPALTTPRSTRPTAASSTSTSAPRIQVSQTSTIVR
jgi:AcrR family transcriptional regulator